jgi:DDE family transposase
MFTDDVRHQVWDQVQSHPVRAFAKFLTPDIFAEAARSCGRELSTCPLNLAHMVWLGLYHAIDETQSFASVLKVTFKLLMDADLLPQQDPTPPPKRAAKRTSRGRSKGAKRSPRKSAVPKRSKHDPRCPDPTKVSEEAFVKARARMPLQFWIALVMLLSDRFAHQHEDRIRWKRFRLLAMDGTLLNLPRYQALRDHYGTARSGKGGTIPQARLVMLQFPLARIPYRFAVAPKKQAEKVMAVPLLAHLRCDDLLLMDRGFWSYGLFSQIQQRGAFFATRKIEQVHLKPIRRLGPKDTLVRLVPTDKRWKKPGWPESLELRRIDYQVQGFRPSALITNVTDPKLVSRQEWVGMATHKAGEVLNKSIYHHRWEIETTFSELKVRQKLSTLKGRTPGTTNYEIASHVLLYLMVRWLMVEAAEAHGLDPLRLSFTEALREVRAMIPSLVTRPLPYVTTVLIPRLLARLAEHVVPERPGRHYPRPNDTKTRDLGHGRKQRPSKLVG